MIKAYIIEAMVLYMSMVLGWLSRAVLQLGKLSNHFTYTGTSL